MFRNEVRVVRTATSKQDPQQKEGEAELGTAMLQFSNVGENNNTRHLFCQAELRDNIAQDDAVNLAGETR